MAVNKFVQSIGVAGLIVPLSLWSAPVCHEAIAEIVSAQGQVNLNPYKTDAWLDISRQEPVCPGDTLRTLQQSRATLRLRNKAVITLDQNTTMTFSAPSENSASWFIQMLKGVTYFRSRQPQRLDVHTPFINAVHQGTEFMVQVGDKDTEISVFDGKVSGENPVGKVSIEKGYKGISGANQVPHIEPLTIKPEDAVQWMLYYPPLIDETLSKSPQNKVLESALRTYRRGDFHGALSQLDQVTDSQRNPDYYSTKAALLLTLGRVDEATQLISQIKSLEPGNSDALALEAVIAVAKNQQQQALALAEQAVAKNPASPTARIAQSYAQQALFDIDAAAKAAAEATRLSPENALAWARLAELQLAQGERGAALKSAQKAQALNPKLARTQTVLGFVNLAETEIAQAKQLLQQAIALDSSDPLARLGLGLAEIRQGDVEAGKTEMESAVNLDPNNAVMRSYLGKAYYELRNKEYAGKEYELAKELDQKDPTPYFYDAILKQTTNRPVEALHDMQKAIELNDNRGVYRSRLLLDKDQAVRTASLGRIFKELGFEDRSRLLATESLLIDPANYSAHRLLADSYLQRPRHEVARASELLQAQLLEPLSFQSWQPQLAYTDLNIPKSPGFAETGFNEYSRLFEGNQVRFTGTGLYGSFDTRSDEAAISGLYDKFAFSLGQMHYQTDGFRKNAGLKHDLYNVFAQYQLLPELSLQAEYRYRDSEHGDIQMSGSRSNFDDTFKRNLHQETYRLGAKFSPEKHSDLLFSFIYGEREEDIRVKLPFMQEQIGTDLVQRGFQLESQYVYRRENFNLTAGGGTYRIDNNSLSLEPFFIPPLPPLFIPQFLVQEQQAFYKNNQTFGYLYSNYDLLKNLTATAGLAYDYYADGNLKGVKVNQLSPKLGLLWRVNSDLTFRAAGFQTVKAPILVNQVLQPMQVAGFNQFFDDINGTRATQYGAGVDAKLSNNFFMGAEAFKRDLDVPLIVDNNFVNEKRNEELYRVYLNWTPHPNWSVNSDMRFENFKGTVIYKSVETAILPITLRFFDETGFFANLGGEFVHQSVAGASLEQESFKSNFFLVDAAVGYRFPKQFGMISLEAKNLLDKNFKYRDRNYQMNEYRGSDLIPERLLFARINFNFN